MNDEMKVHTIAEAVQATLCIRILAGLSGLSLCKWNEATSGMLILGTVQVLIKVVERYSDIPDSQTSSAQPTPSPVDHPRSVAPVISPAPSGAQQESR